MKTILLNAEFLYGSLDLQLDYVSHSSPEYDKIILKMKYVNDVIDSAINYLKLSEEEN